MLTTRRGRIGELLAVASVGVAGVVAAKVWGAHSLLMSQSLIWGANVLMLLAVWAGLKLRGESWEHLGLTFRLPTLRAALGATALAAAVLVAALAAFVLGSVLMSGVTGTASSPDTSGYDYLRGDLPMLVLTLVGVYIVSSFGEEVIYRGFLITRLAELLPANRVGPIGASILSAVVFGAAHYAWGPVGVVQTTMMGLVFAGSYLLLHRNLWILILAHMLMDTLLIVPLYSAV